MSQVQATMSITKDAMSEVDTMIDQMAKTASSTNTSVEQLGEGILKIGAMAKSIKGGTAELNTALGTVLDNTVPAQVLLLIDLVTGNFPQLASDAQNIRSNMKQAASQIRSGIKQVIGSLVQGTVTHVTTLVSGFASTVSALWTSMNISLLLSKRTNFRNSGKV